ncbi:MAG: 30S ribosomal protein S20 [Bdellovibrio sp. CG10_big_fil_rev_8_21_14_0_10_47_8]|nr:MAG: 30S ribosomal protein S20 [Bdellovibrio sp. CG10_big_fil_rev_8_21_14_0_10_47_8]
MANHKSAKKRARQSIKRNTRNSQGKAAVKTYEKTLVKGIEAKSKELPVLLQAYIKKAMSAANKGMLRKETVARKIGRLSTRVHQALTK